MRLNGLKNLADPIIVCNQNHRFLVAEQCHQINIANPTILLEDTGRNTAPAIAAAALQARHLRRDLQPHGPREGGGAEEREAAWERGDWDATWYCTECYMRYYDLEDYAAVCNMLGFTGRAAKKARYGKGKP